MNPIEAANYFYLKGENKNGNAVIGEIAGRDSIYAASLIAETKQFDVLIPTVAYTGTEAGDITAHSRNIEIMKSLLPNSIFISNAINIYSPALWVALNGRFIAFIIDRYGQYSPCLGCHMYFHLCRIPLSIKMGNIPIISGDKDSHNGRIKVSQLPSSINMYSEVLNYAGIELLTPLRSSSENHIKEAVKSQSYYDSKCYFDKNYYDSEKLIEFDLERHEKYLQEFLIPISKSIIDSWQVTNYEQEPDYIEIAKKVLKNL